MKKEEMYNFGLLGKWSNSTLKANLERKYQYYNGGYSYVVPQIESAKKELFERISDELDNYGNTKIKKLTIKNLYTHAKMYEKALKEETQLNIDANKYYEIMKKISKKRLK